MYTTHGVCMYLPPTNTLHCTDYHPCLVPRAFYAIPILHILQFEEIFHLLVYNEYTCYSSLMWACVIISVGIVVCRELPSHIIYTKRHPYLVSSCFYAIPIILVPQFYLLVIFLFVFVVVFSFNKRNSKTVRGIRLKLCTMIEYVNPACNVMLI